MRTHKSSSEHLLGWLMDSGGLTSVQKTSYEKWFCAILNVVQRPNIWFFICEAQLYREIFSHKYTTVPIQLYGARYGPPLKSEPLSEFPFKYKRLTWLAIIIAHNRKISADILLYHMWIIVSLHGIGIASHCTTCNCKLFYFFIVASHLLSRGISSKNAVWFGVFQVG